MAGVFGRRVKFSVGQAGQAGLQLADLRVAFRVAMSTGRNPHTASIRVYNAAPSTLALLDAGPLPTVGLAVGYGDPLVPGGGPGIPRSIFLGEIVRDGMRIEKAGPDSIAEIEAADSPGAYQLNRIALTFPTTVTMSAVVGAIAAQLALPIGLISVVPDVTLAQGATFHAEARDVLDRIADSVGGDWWVSDGVFYFSPKGVPLPGIAPLFSAKQGNLVGSPIKKDRGGVEIVGLLDADMRPGKSFVVESSTINGVYVATNVEFNGDSGFDVPFYVKITGKLPG
tara:strand:+ start:1131 stop:1979 length:849 start_codon:yes stop_codon:yes gene_type:complete